MDHFDCPQCGSSASIADLPGSTCASCGYPERLPATFDAGAAAEPHRAGAGKKILVFAVVAIGGLFLLSTMVSVADITGLVPGLGSNAGSAPSVVQSGDGPADVPADDPPKQPADDADDGGGSEPPATNQGPRPGFTSTCAQSTCQFDASESTDPDGTIVSWTWDFGDGTTGEGAKVEHTYSDASTTWTVRLTVTDDGGASASTTAIPELTAPADTLTFSDSGDAVTSSFNTTYGLLRVTMQHSGSGNFVIWLVGPQGDSEELFVNEIGAYDGSRYFAVPAGTYQLQVTADGSWSAFIEQPQEDGSAPGAKSGTGDTALPAMRLEGRTMHLDLEYDGDSDFVVWLYDANGTTSTLVVSESGSYDGTRTIQIPRDDVYYLDVHARGGAWSIKFA